MRRGCPAGLGCARVDAGGARRGHCTELSATHVTGVLKAADELLVILLHLARFAQSAQSARKFGCGTGTRKADGWFPDTGHTMYTTSEYHITKLVLVLSTAVVTVELQMCTPLAHSIYMERVVQKADDRVRSLGAQHSFIDETVHLLTCTVTHDSKQSTLAWVEKIDGALPAWDQRGNVAAAHN